MTEHRDSESSQSEVIALLSAPDRYDPPVNSVDRIDTHGAIVFLAGEYAYKLKRAVTLAYLDFSSCEKREAVCRNELSRNQSAAPSLYVGVLPIRKRADGELVLGGGEGHIVDWVVKMRRFPQDQLFDNLAAAGRLPLQTMGPLAEEIAAYHDATAAAADTGGYAILSRVTQQTLARLARADTMLETSRLARFAERLCGELEAHKALLQKRSAGGRVRLCHGDLHLKNIVMLNDRPLLFDAIEFDDRLATIDVLYDLAFLLMDLWHRDLTRHANLCFGTYASAGMPADDLDGLALLPLFMTARSTIRAMVILDKVSVAGPDKADPDAEASFESYIALAEALLSPAPPMLLAVGGLSGTGKSTLAAVLAPSLGRPPGALHLRSDVERKRLWGIDPQERLPQEAYSEDISERVYARLCERAERALRAGHAVVADAVFMDPAHREVIQSAARRAGVPFAGLWLEAPPEDLIGRVSARKGDASDAGPEVVRSQLAASYANAEWPTVDARGTPDAVAARARVALANILPATN